MQTAPLARQKETTMQHFDYSPAGLALTKEFEGLRLTAYQDCAGVWTIGYGHTGADAQPGQTISERQADALLCEDLAAAVACVNALVMAAIQQHHFDALVDFCFNAGRGSFARSTLLRDLNRGDFASAAAQFSLWIDAGGKPVAGLVRRRAAEAAMFRGELGAQPSTSPA
jgi:lysozyme